MDYLQTAYVTMIVNGLSIVYEIIQKAERCPTQLSPNILLTVHKLYNDYFILTIHTIVAFTTQLITNVFKQDSLQYLFLYLIRLFQLIVKVDI